MAISEKFTNTASLVLALAVQVLVICTVLI